MKLEKKIDSKDLVSQLNSLDLDDGVRIVGKKKKMFINKAALGEFVMQIKEFNGNEIICYRKSTSSVIRLVNATFKEKFSVSTY
jgi:hypothetical protein